ncbi:uncharacterized protein CIMG_05836 [Coccidioides immitis RS]|uniref:Uncharacterized protein n=1 Tax=Coccidioides immitis (strain RS) TaxID=246410 RepID=J3K6W1_COCIM|nr:uncharacterized protein CIMG_05836 [Coccidioides immitis RS]EAS30357.3 hypothetical protein CIMG_05836 [Coccidioides immitis RS]
MTAERNETHAENEVLHTEHVHEFDESSMYGTTIGAYDSINEPQYRARMKNVMILFARRDCFGTWRFALVEGWAHDDPRRLFSAAGLAGKLLGSAN